MRGLAELMVVEDPAWPLLEEQIARSVVPINVLPGDSERGQACLVQLQVTARSWLGAIALHCGGLLVDDGWVRVFGGAGGSELPSLGQVNGFPAAVAADWAPGAGLVVAQDVLGGVFAINSADAADRPGKAGEMVYFAPDTMAWEALGTGHGDWLFWLLSGELERFYGSMRWPGWREEVRDLPLTHGISIYPPLWTVEGRDIATASRRPVPMAELLERPLMPERPRHPGESGATGAG